VEGAVRRTPLLCFVAAALFAVAALNEGNLHHWGTTIVLGVVAAATAGAGIWSLRDTRDR
jgi:hypothetical protein